MIYVNKKPNNTILIFIVFSAFIIAGGFWWYDNVGVSTLILLVGAVLGWTLSAQRKRHFEVLYGLEQERQAIRTHFEYLVKYANDIILLMDQEGNLKEVNDRAVAAYGCEREELLQLNIRDLVQEGETPALFRGIQQGPAGEGKIFEGYHRRRDRGIFPVEVSVNLIQVEGKKYFQEIIRDITERKQAEAILLEAEQQFRSIFDCANDGIIIADPETKKFIMANPMIVQMLGYTQEELQHLGVMDIHPPDSLAYVLDAFERLLRQELTVASDLPVLRKDGSVFYANISTSHFYFRGKLFLMGIFRDITARKQAEEQLQLKERLLDGASDSIFLHDLDGRFLYLSKAAYRDRGYEKDELLAKDLFTLITPEFAAKREAVLQDLLVKGEIIFESAHYRKDGSVLPVEIHARTIDLGDRRLILSAARDISERKQAEEALRESEEKYRTLFESSAEGYFLMTDIFLDCNEQACKLWKCDREDIIGHSPLEFFPEFQPDGRSSAEAAQEYIAAAFAGTPQFLSWQCRRKDGVLIDTEGSLKLLMVNRQQILLATIRDITERKRAEEAFQVLVNRAPMGIYIVQDSKFKIANPGFEKICGYAEQELIGSDSLALVTPDYREQVRQNAIMMLKGQSHLPYEFSIITKGGETRWVLEKVAPTVYQGQRATLGYFLDVSEHKSLESKFLQAQKMEAVGRLAGGVAHDFNNMLNVILGYCDLMNQELNQYDPLARNLAEIRKAADRAISLTRQLLAFSRKQIIQPQVLNLNEKIAGMEKMILRLIGEDIELAVLLDPVLAAVKADPGHIDQIIMNLTVNARDAMPQGGKLTLETANIYLDESYVQMHAYVTPGPYVMLAVSDNGQGMDAATQAQVFEPFFTTKEDGKGTGLGLSTVYGIVKQAGGHIQVYSEIGRGTTFKVYLPQVQEKVSEISKAKPPAQRLFGSETILVVEDEDMLREIICPTLKRYGYTVLEARHGGEALLLCERHPGPIRLLLTDVVMPQMSGRELSERLAPLRPEMKVLYMSGYTENAVVHHGVVDSAVSFIQKPFSLKILVEKIRKILDEATR